MARLSTHHEGAIKWLEVHREVAEALASSSSLREAAEPILRALGTTLGFQTGAIYRVEPDQLLRCLSTWVAPDCELDEFEHQTRAVSFHRGVALAGRVWESGAPEWWSDLLEEDLARDGLPVGWALRSALAFPMLSARGVLGVIELLSIRSRGADEDLATLTVPLGWQLGERMERDLAEERARIREARLAHSEALLSEAERGAATGSFDRDLRSGQTEFSVGMHDLLRAPPGVGLTLERLLARVHSDDRELIGRVFSTAEHDHQPFVFEL
ncbi:MAG TPA: GAF domain-containing protein, partial [Solirubrobacteraceae bacterium]